MDIMTAPPGKGDRSTFETLRVIVSEMTHIKWTQRAESAVAMPEGKRIHLRQKDIDRTTHASRRKEGFNFKNAARWSSLTCVPYFYIKKKKSQVYDTVCRRVTLAADPTRNLRTTSRLRFIFLVHTFLPCFSLRFLLFLSSLSIHSIFRYRFWFISLS